ncbi:50S ribosomal protein L15e [Candidatus Micrarchaeota archaeon]|nr:50S ribosomal protein L15e [Candidatus Micrarchaeota archaeon]MBU1166604.1 50S ribosomal protein L15e [Candidatus Micrarchaeota archaeon]MBU1887264.1 50S ribosomal protein L15e [Candidatus Micrarchaeota archaeon]
MGAYKYIVQTLQKQYKERNDALKAKIVGWGRGPVMERVERPTNLSRARTLGYKAKQGYAVIRIRIDKGRRTRRKPDGGRKQKNNYLFVQPQLSHQGIAEQRVNRKYRNMEVLNSYWIGENGKYKYFEVILADPAKPTVNISSVIRTGKAFRGLTSTGNSRTPSKKKTLNKKLRRKKKQATVYHYEPYVKKEKVETDGKKVKKAIRKPKVKKVAKEKSADKKPKEKKE